MSRYYDDVLIHHGKKGQKWGSKNGPPYPLNASGLAKFREKAAAFKKKQDDQKAAKIAKKEAKKQTKREKKLEELSRNPTYLWKNRAAYSTAELNKALERINTEQRLHEASVKQLRRGKDIADTIIGYGKTVNDAYKTLNNMSNNYRKFKNGEFGKEQMGDKDKKKKDKGKDQDKDKDNDDVSRKRKYAKKAVDFLFN